MVQSQRESVPEPPSTILVVEDDPEIQQMLRDLLARDGYEIVAASDGAAALERLEDGTVDLVLLDVMLPDMMGYEVCRQIRHGTLSSVPIIMLTALTQPEQAMAGLQTGADDYIRKPFDPRELMARIERQLQRHEELGAREHEVTQLHAMLELTQRQLTGARGIAQTESVLRQEFLTKVTTHFQALAGVIEAQIRRLPPGTARDAVQQIKMRVRGAGLVYEVSAALQTDPAPIGDVVRTITAALKSVYRPWKRVKVTVNGGDVLLPAVVAAPMAMVVNGLITNAFKHAYPENRFGALVVDYGMADQTFYLRVADDGVGIQPSLAALGSGSAAVRQIVGGLDGTVEWTSGTTGTTADVRVPVPPDMSA